MTRTQTIFRARNQNPTIKALAERAAAELSRQTGKPHRVEYRDRGDACCVVGDFLVVAT